MHLPRAFFARPVAEVAPELLGCTLYRRTAGGCLAGRIVETEAYGGRGDPGSHAFRGPTPRTQVMFGPPGHLYVYRSYGMHACMNIVCEPVGTAAAVLIRALEPVDGVDVMVRSRGGKRGVDLCNGPGKLCQALDITLALNGIDVEEDVVWVEEGSAGAPVETSTRIGLSQGTDLPLRFFLGGNPYVSKGRPGGRQRMNKR